MSVSKFSKFFACVLGLNFMLPFYNCPKVNAGNTSSSSVIPDDAVWTEGPFECSLKKLSDEYLLKIELKNKDFYRNKLSSIDRHELNSSSYNKLGQNLTRYIRSEQTNDYHEIITLLGNQVIDVLADRPKWKEKITKIEIGEGIQWIGNKAFYADYKTDSNGKIEKKEGYINLKSITLPNSLLGIGTRAFANSGVKDITIPKSVREISDFAFCNCKNLLKVKIEGDEKVPSSLESIGKSAFSYSGVKYITIPKSVRKISDCAFYNCEDLLKVKIEGEKEAPGSLECIGNFAFAGCTSLLSLKLPYSKVQDITNSSGKEIKIDNKAFYDCVSLSQLDIPNTIQSVGRLAFGNCASLAFVEVDEKRTQLHVNQYDKVDVFEGCVNLLVDKSEPLHLPLRLQYNIF